MNKSKPVYKLRWEDIIPFFIGMNRYNRRCRWEEISQDKPGGGNLEDYYKKCSIRKLVLGLYNSVLVAVPVGGTIFGLVKLILA